MPEDESMDLVIILEIMKYLNLRTNSLDSKNAIDGAQILNIINNLAPGSRLESSYQAHVGQTKETVMGDRYVVGQAGAVGPGSMAAGQHFFQIWAQQESPANLAELAHDLMDLRCHGRNAADGSAEYDIALAELAYAEVSAKEGDGPEMMGHLARAGKWALDLAKEVGSEVLAKVIESSMGFK